MKNITTKISLFILLTVLISACNALKKVPTNKHLLKKNEITVDGAKNNDEDILNQIIQKPNTSILGFKLRLNMFNLANNNTDSIFRAKYTANPKKYKRKAKWLSKKQVDRLGQSFWYAGWHNFLRKTGEPPVVIDTFKTKRTIKRLKDYYINRGFFDIDAKYNVAYSKDRKSAISYTLTKGKATFLDTISHKIESQKLDSLFLATRNKSFIKQGQQYNLANFENERTRITNYFRNHGAFNFQQQSINFEIDTTSKKAPVTVIITNQVVKSSDTTKTKPYRIYKIGEVNVFTKDLETKNKTQLADSAVYKNLNLYSTYKLRYKPKAISDAIFIQKGTVYSDDNRTLTLRSLSNLRVFNYPNIQFIEDTITNTLKTNIYLIAKDKYSFRPKIDVTHSNIQEFGISGSASLSIRNLFRGAEILEIGFRGNIGSSKQSPNLKDNFFNVSEYGGDVRLNFPRLLLPFKTEKIIPKSMYPSTILSTSFTKQVNIGLDKESLSGVLNYNWIPKKNNAARFDLINIQYVKNINVGNYFRVYNSSYTRLNNFAKIYNTNTNFLDAEGNLSIEGGGANNFINSVISNQISSLNNQNPDYKTINSIKERKDRLTENNLILSSNFTFTKDTKKDIFDKQFSIFKTKIEISGNLLSLLAKLSNQPVASDGVRELFGLQYSQYIKSELDFIKHFELYGGNILAIRSFVGIAIPYGNSKSIPFSRSYFAGGSNDNRGWQSYSLGPGTSGGLNDFNEANLKIALNAELRFNVFGNFYSAIFTDLGNIWNVLDSETDQTKVFSNLKSLKGLALGTGIGLIRYDFKFFVARLDLGFKTYNPAKPSKEQWLKEINLSKSVLNIGINYPF